MNPPAASIESPSGIGTVSAGCATATSAKPPIIVTAITGSPGSNSPLVDESTVPATSTPGTNGSGGLVWYRPRLMSRSGKLTPADTTSMSTPSPASGSGSSTSRSASGPVSSETCWALTTALRYQPPVGNPFFSAHVPTGEFAGAPRGARGPAAADGRYARLFP